MNVLGQSRKFLCALSAILLCVMMSLKAIKLFSVCQEIKREFKWFKTVLKNMIFQNNVDRHYEIMSTLLFHYILLMSAHI